MRFPRPGASLVLVSILAPLACRVPQSIDDSPNAALIRTCAPWDGPAASLFLTDRPAVPTYPTPPYRSITIYRDVTELVGQRFEVTATTQQVGIAQDCPSAGSCTSALGATVQFRGLSADSTMLVTYRFESVPGEVQNGSVRARVYPRAGMCG